MGLRLTLTLSLDLMLDKLMIYLRLELGPRKKNIGLLPPVMMAI